jgi:phenylacetate-CoA ligase
MAVANTGVNVDVALAMVRACAPHFEQLIVVSQPPFAKKLLEDGIEQGVDWKRFRTTLVAGGEGFVESWRTYVSGLLGITDPDNPGDTFVASTMGAAELGLFHEIPETIRIIRRAYRDSAFRRALLGPDVPHTPHFFVFYPMRSFIEEIPVPGWPIGDLAVSLAAPDLPMPHFRYRTGDLARIVPYRALESVLAQHARDLAVPALRLPCVAIFGRRDGLEVGGRHVMVETVKEALFQDPTTARAVTGFFRVSKPGSGLRLEVQLRGGFPATGELRDRFGAALASAVPEGGTPEVRLHGLADYPYPTTYERKHAYLTR